MTTDELKKEAEEKWWNEDTVSGASTPNKIYITGYLASAEPREKRIAELEAENNDLCDSLETQDLKIAELEKEAEEYAEAFVDRGVAEASFIKGAEFGYNKANEWHYVKDGLPEELHDVLCFVIHNEHRFVLQGYLRDGRWVLSPLGTYLNNDDVIAWKEIVLPKEIGK